jgi:hypothetical protein
MDVLPDELWLEIIDQATHVPYELDPNLDDYFRIPRPLEVETSIRENMQTRRTLVQISRSFHRWASPILYRTVILDTAKAVNRLYIEANDNDVSRSSKRFFVRRLHVVVGDKWSFWFQIGAAARENLMSLLPNIIIYHSRGELYDQDSAVLTPLDSYATLSRLQAVECASVGVTFVNLGWTIARLIHNSPMIRVFLICLPRDACSSANLCALRHLKSCYFHHLQWDENAESSTPNGAPAQPETPPIRSLRYINTGSDICPHIAQNITTIEIQQWSWVPGQEIRPVNLDQFPRLRTLILHGRAHGWTISAAQKSLREIGLSMNDADSSGLDDHDDLVFDRIAQLPMKVERVRVLYYVIDFVVEPRLANSIQRLRARGTRVEDMHGNLLH